MSGKLRTICARTAELEALQFMFNDPRQPQTPETSNIPSNQRSSTQQSVDFTNKRNEGFAFLNFSVLHCLANWLSKKNLEQTRDTEGAVRWRLLVKAHEPDKCMSRVGTLAQRCMNNIVILHRLVTTASCLNTCAGS